MQYLRAILDHFDISRTRSLLAFSNNRLIRHRPNTMDQFGQTELSLLTGLKGFFNLTNSLFFSNFITSKIHFPTYRAHKNPLLHVPRKMIDKQLCDHLTITSVLPRLLLSWSFYVLIPRACRRSLSIKK